MRLQTPVFSRPLNGTRTHIASIKVILTAERGWKSVLSGAYYCRIWRHSLAERTFRCAGGGKRSSGVRGAWEVPASVQDVCRLTARMCSESVCTRCKSLLATVATSCNADSRKTCPCCMAAENTVCGMDNSRGTFARNSLQLPRKLHCCGARRPAWRPSDIRKSGARKSTPAVYTRRQCADRCMRVAQRVCHAFASFCPSSAEANEAAAHFGAGLGT